MGWREDWIRNHYDMDKDGNFRNKGEYECAIKNGDLKKDARGNYYDSRTGQYYWNDGTKRG